MPLEPGQRLQAIGQGTYHVDRSRESCAWYGLYDARKVFMNYRYHDRQVYEAAQDEWIQVQIRTLGEPDAAASDDFATRAELLREEGTQVLARHLEWFPEPLDLIEYVPPVAEGNGSRPARQPVLVMALPRGEPLSRWAPRFAGRLPWKFAVCLELLDLFDSLHREGRIAGAFGPDDFLIDENGRLTCLAGDRIILQARSLELRPYFPPTRYPLEAAAPEVHREDGALNVRSDLFNWAALTVFLIVEQFPSPAGAPGENPPDMEPHDEALAKFAAVLEEVSIRSPHALRGLSPRLARATQPALVAEWMKAVRWCLEPDPAHRPDSVRALRERPGAASRPKPLRKLWRELLGGA